MKRDGNKKEIPGHQQRKRQFLFPKAEDSLQFAPSYTSASHTPGNISMRGRPFRFIANMIRIAILSQKTEEAIHYLKQILQTHILIKTALACAFGNRMEIQSYPAGERLLLFGIIALNCKWTNELRQKEETHSNIDDGDSIVRKQGSSEYSGADAEGSFFDFAVVPPEIGDPLSQIGRTNTITPTQYK